MDPPSPARSRASVATTTASKTTTAASRVTKLVGVVTIDNMDLTRPRGPFINSPRSLRACALEGVAPDEDFVVPKSSQLRLQCGGDKDAAIKRREHLLARRDQLVSLVRSRRARLVETEQSQPIPDEDTPSEEQRPEYSHPRSRTHVEKIRAVMEANEKREKQKLEYIQLMRLKFEKQQEERAEEKIRFDEMKRREIAEEKERALSLRDEQFRREAKQRRDDERKVEEQRRRAIEIELQDQARERILELRRAEVALGFEERQQEVRAKHAAISGNGKNIELEKQERLESKLQVEADRLKELEDRRNEDRRRQKEHHDEMAKQALIKKQQSEEKKAASAEYTRMQVENAMKRTEEFEKNKKAEWYYKTAVEAKAEKRRIATQQRNKKANSEQQSKLLAKIEETDSKRDDILNDRSAGWRQRKLEADLEMADKLYAVKRVQRLKDLEAEELQKEADRKVARIESIQEEAKRLQKQRVMVKQEMDRIRSKVKIPVTSLTPGPQSYEVQSSEAYIRTSTAVTKIGNSSRPAMKVDHTPGPGHYNLPSTRKARAALLPPRTTSFWKKHASIGSHSEGKAASSRPQRSTSVDITPPIEVTAEDRRDTPQSSPTSSPRSPAHRE